MERKGTKMEPKGSKWNEKGANTEPKCVQNASKKRCPKKGAKRRHRRNYPPDHFGSILVHFPLKIRKKKPAKTHLKNDTEKVKKMSETTPKMEPKRELKSMKNRNGDFMKMMVFHW